MKILITEQQLKTINELGGQIKDETEVIYKDRNIVCIIPKSQMSSKMFGKNTHWCSINQTGFETWSHKGMLFRFIFKGGKKIRLTYLFNDTFNWANENGFHTLEGYKNPFNVKDTGSPYKNEKDVLNYINIIPEECKNKVLNFINDHIKEYNYCYKEEELRIKREEMFDDLSEKVDDIVSDYYIDRLNAYNKNSYFDIRAGVNRETLKPYISHNFYNQRSDKLKTEYFNNIVLFEKRYVELIKILKILTK